MNDLAMIVPMQVISMLVGIPEKDQGKLRQMSEDALQRAYDPEQAPFAAMGAINAVFDEYIAWRKEHPSDDLLTKMLNLTFEDPERRRLAISRTTRCSPIST